MLRRVDFWKEESEAPLLRLNRLFLPSKDIDKQIEDNHQGHLSGHFEYERIIRLDAERTYAGVAQRKTLMDVLAFLRQEFGSYHQAMSYVAGFLLLTRSPIKVIEIMRQLHQNVLIGYWKEEPIAFATDAYVFDYLLADYHPDVHQHLSKHFVLPETYAQKWFTTLCVGVLPFKALFRFFEIFLSRSLSTSSNVFLFQFALSLIKHVREGLIQTKSVAVIYQYLRLDLPASQSGENIDDMAMSIVEGAKDYDLSSYDFPHLRQKAFEEKLRQRLEAANRAHQQNKEEQPSSSTSSDSDDDQTSSSTTIKTLVDQMKNLHIE